jgi:hypothetical protein
MVSTPNISKPRVLPTRPAASYIGVSVSLMRKWRTRGAGDPGSHGPPYIKLGPTLCVYELDALDAWLDSRRDTVAA